MENKGVLVSSVDPAAAVSPDQDALFQSQMQQSLGAAYRLAAVILGNQNEAEDATQEALERAWRSRHQLREPDRFSAWFQRILVNACRDRARRSRSTPTVRTVSLDVSGLSSIGSTRDLSEESAQRDALSRALHRINVDQRVVIAMRFYLDLEIDEIARRTGFPVGTVKSRLHRGLKELRSEWESLR